MKKISFVTCAMLLTLGSCTSEIDEEGVIDTTNAISFNPYSAKTRAYTAGDVDITTMRDGSFGVVGYTTSDHNLYLGKEDKAVEQQWNGTAWDYTDGTELKFWPSASNMNFYAYFPYSAANGDVFASSDASGDVMTITNNTGNQDVLFAHVVDRALTSGGNQVQLYFYHALSKIKSIQIKVNTALVDVEVQNVKILNTYTKGKIKVNNQGCASYSDETEPRSLTLVPAKTINSTTEEADRVLFNNSSNCYLFATNTGEKNKVYGTGNSMWDGTKAMLGEGGQLSTSNLVCLQLTCKVKANGEYLVGSVSDYDKMYIPMRGINNESTTVTELLAGHSYIYNIIMDNNVGYKDNGDPIKPSPILFGVSEVNSWKDVVVTVTL